jgi:hypothetical protein
MRRFFWLFLRTLIAHDLFLSVRRFLTFCRGVYVARASMCSGIGIPDMAMTMSVLVIWFPRQWSSDAVPPCDRRVFAIQLALASNTYSLFSEVFQEPTQKTSGFVVSCVLHFCFR